MTTQTARRYQSRPFQVDAIRWDGTNEAAVSELAGGWDRFHALDEPNTDDPEATAAIRHPDHNDWRLVHTGDWIVRRDDGRVFRLPDDAFQAAYEDVRYDQGGLLPSAVEVRTNRTGQALAVVTRDQLRAEITPIND